MPRLPLLAAGLALLLAGPQLRAQGADVVRGRVVDDSSRALPGALVIITRGPDRLIQQDTTDADGRYSLRFDPGTGDYLVNVASPGFRTARRRVQRAGAERELVADFIMARDLATLATVNVTANRPVRASANVSPTTVEAGANEQWSNGVNGRVTPGAAGDLNALAGTMPGVTMTGSGPSMLGAAVTSNLTTLNGMALPGGTLPRAARTETRVTGATFDATRGGFAGANIDVRLGPGDRNFQNRNAFFTLDAPQLQMTDAVGRSLGLVNGGFRASVAADGEAIRRALTYNVSVDVAHNASEPSTLLGGDPDAWRRAGVSPDSVSRLLAVAGSAGIPIGGSGIPLTRKRDGLTFLGRFDDVRDTLRTLTLTTYAAYNKEGALGFGPLTAPGAGGESTDRTLGVQLMHSAFVGPGYYVLTQNRLAASHVRQRTNPYQALPGATVLVRSESDASASDVAALSLGGSRLDADDARWTLEGSNETVWMARGTRHRFKSQLWGRADGLTQTGQPNRLGQYTYNSLADFAANRPASYSRVLTQPDREATTYNGAAALAHQWNKSRWFNMIYGARVEANAFGDAPPANPALESALGVRSGLAPARLHVSPRVGFSYTYSRAKENGSGTNMNQIGRFYRTTMGYIRGGIGEFRDLYAPRMLADAVAGTGIAGSTLSLSCVGAAVPVPDWDAFAASPSSLPTACADGTTALGERAPSVTLLDRSFDAPRSWRGTLSWGSSFGRWMTKVDALGSYDLSQPSTLDANFSGASRFTLPGEANRPVFVSTGAIDPTTGFVSARESRRSADFGRVALRASDLRGYGGQITTTIQPDVFRNRSRITFFTSASYTLQRTLQQFRGSDGASFGDPRVTEWGTGMNDARHAVVFQGGVYIPKVGSITAFSRFQSGLPFTPLVQGDIDGDGRASDRAYVPNPSASSTDASLRTSMRALLDAAPANVRQCLERQLGDVAGRNSCRGPWTQQLSLQWTPRIPLRVQGRNIQANVVFENPLAGIDQMLHGANGLKGWGTRAAPDPVLLVPRGFDAASRSYRYDVNPRFGDTRAFRTLSRTPFRVTLDFSLNFSTPYDVQQLRRALEPVKTKSGWERRTADSITAYYLQNTSSIHKMLLAESDSLFLSKEQIDRFLEADSLFGVKVRAIFGPLGQYLAEQPGGVPGKAALDSANASDKLYWQVFWEQVDVMAPIVTQMQKELMPMLPRMIAVSAEDRKNSQWQFGYPVTVRHTRPRVGGEIVRR